MFIVLELEIVSLCAHQRVQGCWKSTLMKQVTPANLFIAVDNVLIPVGAAFHFFVFP